MPGLAGQHDDTTRRIGLDAVAVEALAEPDIEDTRHHRIDPVLRMLVRHQFRAAGHLHPHLIWAGLGGASDHHRKPSAGREGGKRLPVDVLGQDRSELGLIGLMIAGHGAASFRTMVQPMSLASSVMVAFRTLETGQFFSASPAMRANPASSRFGTLPRKVSADLLILNPLPSGSSVTAASVESCAGVKPASCRPKASAMVKQPA